MSTSVEDSAAPFRGAAPPSLQPASPIGSARLRPATTRRAVLATMIAVLAALEVAVTVVLAVQAGTSIGEMTDQHALIDMVVAVSFAAVAAVVIRHRPGHVLGWLFAVEAQMQGISGLAGAYGLDHPEPGLAHFLGEYLWFPGMVMAAGLFTTLFPDGRPEPRWRWIVWVAVAAVVTASLAGPFAMRDEPPPVLLAVAVGGLLTAVACGIVGAVVLAVRMFRTSGPERGRIAWFFTAFVVVVACQLLPVSPLVPTIATGFVPVALGVAMVRDGLFDGDRLLNRTLVYVSLTALVVAVFGLVVGLASTMVGGAGTGAVAAGVMIALGLAPARTAVQRVVDHLLYGERRDPYAALTRLGEHLSVAIATDDVLPIVVRTVTAALRIPYAAVTLRGESVPAATQGASAGPTVDIELQHLGKSVGVLTVGLPAGQRFLDPSDERLLTAFARHAGAAAAAVRLTTDLRRSRDSLAVARDEERHRIRRDLHDGLGPTLAGVALGLGAARRAVTTAAPETADLLGDLQAEVQQSLDDVKALIADLRPSTLEEIGLVEALRQYADSVTARSQGQLKVTVDAADHGTLPGEVEVAAYRIVLEAVTNTARHAHASQCVIEVTADSSHSLRSNAPSASALRLTVRDDGIGVKATPTRPGLGLRSMAERATELGGSCTVAAGPTGGTVVSAVLPFGSLS